MAAYSTTFTRESLTDLRNDVMDALEILRANGLNIEFNGSTFDAHEVIMKVKFTNRSPEQDFMAKLKDNENFTYRDGKLVQVFFPEDYDRLFTVKGKTYRVIGLNWNSKFKVVCRECKSGKTLSWTGAAYLEAIGRAL